LNSLSISACIFDDSSEVNGGLRVLPGTHKQGNISVHYSEKAYFLNNQNDKNEVLVRAKKGDLVIHDGRMWHRVAPSPLFRRKKQTQGNLCAFDFWSLSAKRCKQ
jgi:hypothetical protein